MEVQAGDRAGVAFQLREHLVAGKVPDLQAVADCQGRSGHVRVELLGRAAFDHIAVNPLWPDPTTAASGKVKGGHAWACACKHDAAMVRSPWRACTLSRFAKAGSMRTEDATCGLKACTPPVLFF
eukprot:360121-Chlamydomonas_euryale.AAC.14